ncbi:Asp23/Gls24 family envelope stress response protein [Anaerosalibacter sp. Marseille-P3206]|uniref:Asp23/Gls24 family envelope stress response protein n=1 Tax=Anaerosalibacter sp. Marseille-P3206 TaxID=1871005 RepID=UPI000987A35C|nr:Asp23/Gls24 family envelope stress response protein [Anaerosalibacter sp. Marseille-P3206]
MGSKFKNDYGTVSIDDSVLATIAGLSAMECYGIVGMASKNATEGFFELVKWENLSKGVKVYTQDNEITVDLHVILQYGVRITVVAANIIEKVKYNLENYTGLNVSKINVLVQGINVQK